MRIAALLQCLLTADKLPKTKTPHVKKKKKKETLKILDVASVSRVTETYVLSAQRNTEEHANFHLPTYVNKTHLPLSPFLHLPNRKFEHTV